MRRITGLKIILLYYILRSIGICRIFGIGKITGPGRTGIIGLGRIIKRELLVSLEFFDVNRTTDLGKNYQFD